MFAQVTPLVGEGTPRDAGKLPRTGGTFVAAQVSNNNFVRGANEVSSLHTPANPIGLVLLRTIDRC